MKNVLITGARGFIGRNLTAHLSRQSDLQLFLFDVDSRDAELKDWLEQADIIFHLAGVNRPQNVSEFEPGNAGFTSELCDELRRLSRMPKIVMSSSIQAELENPYGVSKRRAEKALIAFANETGAAVSIYRLKNVFGKWCRPNYNSVTATFCHNIAHDLPISISDPAHAIELIYVDDVVEAFIQEMDNPEGPQTCYAQDSITSTCITLSALAGQIQAFHEMKSSLMTP